MNIVKKEIQSKFGYSVGDWFIHERSKHFYCIDSIIERSDGITIYNIRNMSLHNKNKYEWYHHEISNMLKLCPSAKVLYGG